MSDFDPQSRQNNPGGRLNPGGLRMQAQQQGGLRPQGAPARGAAPAGRGKPARDASGPADEDMRGLGRVLVRNEFYKDGFRILQRVALLQAFIIAGLVGAIFFVIHAHQPENRYFATTEDGRLVPMVPLSEPNLSTPALMSWVAQSSTEVMTFGFNDYRRRLQEASRNFTRRGWESFTKALEQSRIIESVDQNQQVLTATPSGAPIIVTEGIIQGRYQWTVQLPMVLTYQSGTKKKSDSLLVTVVVVRVTRLESPNGVGIEQWVAVSQ